MVVDEQNVNDGFICTVVSTPHKCVRIPSEAVLASGVSSKSWLPISGWPFQPSSGSAVAEEA
jgi:hypothetical protein